MKQRITEEIEIPSGISCLLEGKTIKCRKDSKEASKKIEAPCIKIALKDNKITLLCEKGNKRDYKTIKSCVSHFNVLFKGLNAPYIYKLESCNVHFPMTLKIEKSMLIVNNFLGEKTPRRAKILPGVDVEIKANKISVSSFDKEAAGQTAANFEKATKIRNRDRRVFQDGIFLTEKPAGGAR